MFIVRLVPRANLPFVKTLRLCLLLLLAALLPLRGAIAAAMPCAGIGHQAPVALDGAQDHSEHHMHSVADGDEQDLDHDHGASHHEHAGADRCNLCSSCCSATPMLATFSSTVVALEEPAADYPAFQASASTFLSDGQERPPRSI